MKDNNVNDYNSNNINNYFFSDDNFFVNNLFFYENVDNDVNCEFNNKIDSKSNDSKCNDGFDDWIVDSFVRVYAGAVFVFL